MPKKASMTPAKQQPKTTRMPKAETDQAWSKLTKSDTPGTKVPSTPKVTRKKKSETNTQTTSTIDNKLVFIEDTTKFPHGGFPIRLEYKDNNDKRTCWFQCYDHFEKHITRYKITEYEAVTNDVALVGQSTGRKGTPKR